MWDLININGAGNQSKSICRRCRYQILMQQAPSPSARYHDSSRARLHRATFPFGSGLEGCGWRQSLAIRLASNAQVNGEAEIRDPWSSFHVQNICLSTGPSPNDDIINWEPLRQFLRWILLHSTPESGLHPGAHAADLLNAPVIAWIFYKGASHRWVQYEYSAPLTCSHAKENTPPVSEIQHPRLSVGTTQ